MRKFFINLTLVMSSIFANAQTIIPVHEGQGLLRKSDEKIVLNKSSNVIPSRAASLDDTTLWGYYFGDIDVDYAMGVNSTTTYYVGYFVPGDGVLQGSSINGVNLPIYTKTYMTNVSVWISENLEEANAVTKNVAVSSLNQLSFNAIAFDEPYAIPETGVYVGVKFTISRIYSDGEKYPVICGNEIYENSLLLKYGTQKWADYSDQYGCFAMQLFCSNVTLPKGNAYFKSATPEYTLVGEEVSLPVVIASEASEDVNSIDYTVEINGNKTSLHHDLTTPIPSGIGKSGNTTISFTAPEKYGTYTANINIDKVNGNDNAASANVLSVTNKAMRKMAPRRTVIEEFTGTNCGFCPRGWVGMEMLKETKENFIGIAFHQYNKDDPMYVANYYPKEKLGINGAPGCAMDRRLLGIDPYYGVNRDSGSVIDDFDKCNSIYPGVDVSVSGKFNDDCTAVDITADIEYIDDEDEYTVVYVLTADSLKGTTNAWMQYNQYASLPPTGDPLLDRFCSGGEYGSNFVPLTYNDVMIGSSYDNSGVNQASALAGEVKSGDMVTTSYTVNMPTSSSLREAINNDEVYAIVLVIAGDGTIANAAKAKVTGAETGIEQAIANTNAKEVARYNAAGQIISAPQKGLNIIKLSNGKPLKVIVK